jgi:hypothetical protein
MPHLEDAKRPIPDHETAPRIPQAGDLSPGHLRHGHGKAIYLRGHTAPNRHIVRVVSQWAMAGYTDIPQNAKPDLSHLPHFAIEAKAVSNAVVLVVVVVSEVVWHRDMRCQAISILSSKNVVMNRRVLNKTRRLSRWSQLERCQL